MSCNQQTEVKTVAEERRFSITIPPNMAQALDDLRKTDEYCRCSYAEIIRHLMRLGLEQVKAER